MDSPGYTTVRLEHSGLPIYDVLMDEPLWRPGAARVAASNMSRFTRRAEAVSGRNFKSYSELHDWSITEPGAFWNEVWKFTGVRASRLADAPVKHLDRFPGAVWFAGAKLNYAENLLRYRDERTALVSYLETGARREISFAELHRQTLLLAAKLAELGVGRGDRVAGWLPNTIEAVVAMLATASLGGVWSSCSPDFGAEGALDRFGQIQPKVLFACDGYYYNGNTIDVRDKVLAVVRQVPSVTRVVWVSITGAASGEPLSFAALLEGSATTQFAPSLAGKPSSVRGQDQPFEQVDFNDPLYILYSSGTTGRPKCIVHGVGGTLLQHLKEHQLHVDLGRQDKLFFFTTCGWMMWNWLVSALATGCTLVLYDGSPFHPGASALWDIAEREGVTVFGVGARHISVIEKHGLKPRTSHNLAALRTLISTGSTLTHEGFRYVYRNVKRDLHLISMTGGTDLISCFVLGNPNLPVYAGELQCRGLGMAVDVWNDAGFEVRGEKGELVCTLPFPSCPVGFWQDPGDVKLRAAYFAKYPNVWAQGDFAEITEHGGFIVHGRSDAVLNPGGVRIGTAEVYRQVERIDEVIDAVCVGQDWDGDTRVVLFVVLRPGTTMSPELAGKIASAIRDHASPRHVPRKIVAVPDVPRTMSGKIAELAVRDVIHGRPVRNTTALANPEALDAFVDLAELAT